MATSYKVLGQVVPAATAATSLYTVPASLSIVGSYLCICNHGVSSTVRAAVRPGGAALDPKHYILYDAPLNQYETMFLTIGISAAATDVITVYAGHANVSFGLFGAEIQ